MAPALPAGTAARKLTSVVCADDRDVMAPPVKTYTRAEDGDGTRMRQAGGRLEQVFKKNEPGPQPGFRGRNSRETKEEDENETQKAESERLL